MQVRIENNELVIRIKMQDPAPSKKGKTLIVATTHGFVTTTVEVDGKPVVISLNAYITR